eukprot:TRINITY_DN567_c0_g1_i1.p1 TRINITY_DN567_c0_g1~~TRINITY_DN567_c0_g1_i1.p1  ORF type:complete len:265 (-),score=48.46 TRINITY_DN567_c0_g1_i1:497-1291(-)
MTGELEKGGVKVSLFQHVKNIVAKEGVSGLYAGLSAAIVRQAVFTGARFGLYSAIYATLTTHQAGSLLKKITVSAFAGGLSAVISNPLDLVLVRMQSDGRLPEHLRRNYKNVFHGVYSIWKNEGPGTLWRGSSPNVARAVFVTSSQISSYDTFKEFLRSRAYPDSFKTHFISSLFAGFVTSIVACPADFLRTRYMNSKIKGLGGTVSYSSLTDAIWKISKTEGIMGFYKGWVPYYARVAPHVLSLFIFFEQTNNLLDHLHKPTP